MNPKIYQNLTGPIAPFFTKESPLSNWHPCRFALRGLEFNCVEQYMMWAKAMTFGDQPIAAAILNTADPAEHKALGRRVKGFDPKVWGFCAPGLVREALLAKFSQVPSCHQTLMSVERALFVEASKYDKIWGCGLEEGDPRLLTMAPSEWPGANQLGKLLTSLRDAFAKSHSYLIADGPAQAQLL